MEKGFLVPNGNPIFEGSKQMILFNDFFIPQLARNGIQVLKYFVLTVFNKGSDSILLDLIHDDFGAIDFLGCIF